MISRNPMKYLARDEQGVAMIEFILVLPFLFVLLFGGIEISRLILIQQKLEKVGYVLADMTTQYMPYNSTQGHQPGVINNSEIMKSVLPTVGRLMAPYNANASQSAIITSVLINPNGVMTIAWQRAGGGSLAGSDTFGTQVKSIVNGAEPSSLGKPGDVVNFTDDILIGYKIKELPATPGAGSRNIIVTEAFFKYTPLLNTLLSGVTGASAGTMAGFNFYIPERTYVKRTYFLPRKGNLDDLRDLPV